MPYRTVNKDDDTKALSETDRNVCAMGFRPTLESVRECYGEDWEELPPAYGGGYPPALPGGRLVLRKTGPAAGCPC